MSSLAHLLPPTTTVSTTSRTRIPSTNSIPLLSSEVALWYTRLHTASVLAYLYVSFPSLVADPLAKMTTDAVVLAVAQGLWCAACLPGVGQWVGTTGDKEPGKEAKEGKERGVTSGAGVVKGPGSGSLRRKGVVSGTVKGGSPATAGAPWASRIMPTLFSLILATTLPTLPLTLLALTMGAPLYPTTTLPLTALLSLHVSLLTTTPLFYAHGISARAWRDILSAWLPFDAAGVWGGSVGTFVGCWIGAVPVALDWDREWQAWPVTVLTGGYIGWALGRALTVEAGLGVGRRIDLSEGEGVPVGVKQK